MLEEEKKLSINLLIFVAQKDCVLCEVVNYFFFFF